MSEIKCPQCGKMFSLDEDSYAWILKQVRDEAFLREVEEKKIAAVKLAEAEKDKQITELKQQIKAAAAEKELAVRTAVDEKQKTVDEKERELSELRTRMADQEKMAAADKDAAVKDFTARASKKIYELKEQLNRADAEKELAVQKAVAERDLERQRQETQIQVLKSQLAEQEKGFLQWEADVTEQHSLALRQKDEEIAFYKDLKARMSTKMIGETLEQHCEAEFSRIRSAAFSGAYFEKDNDASLGTKGDYIFRDFDEDGGEYISIMFEMKNEEDGTAGKHKNEDFLKKLDKDRRDKHCEYAALVSLLEPDSEIYNAGIVDMSHRYPKMYVVRPQFFVPLLCLLRDMARSSLAYRRELNELKKQDLDIERFTSRLQTFKDKFSKDVMQASDRFAAAIKEIDSSIERLQKAKAALLVSEKHLHQANSKAEDLTIKRLTAGSPALAAKFAEAEDVDEESERSA